MCPKATHQLVQPPITISIIQTSLDCSLSLMPSTQSFIRLYHAPLNCVFVRTVKDKEKNIKKNRYLQTQSASLPCSNIIYTLNLSVTYSSFNLPIPSISLRNSMLTAPLLADLSSPSELDTCAYIVPLSEFVIF